MNTKNSAKKPVTPAPQPVKLRRYEVVFFDTFAQARDQIENLKQQASQCDQLNVVIRAEGNMDDPVLVGGSSSIKVFAGAAWTLIHERRIEDHWYETLQP